MTWLSSVCSHYAVSDAFGAPESLDCGSLTTCTRYLTSPQWLPALRTTEVHCSGDNVWGQTGSNDQAAQHPARPVKVSCSYVCEAVCFSASSCLFSCPDSLSVFKCLAVCDTALPFCLMVSPVVRTPFTDFNRLTSLLYRRALWMGRQPVWASWPCK